MGSLQKPDKNPNTSTSSTKSKGTKKPVKKSKK